MLGNEWLAIGLLDRLTFQSHTLEFRGDSLRLRHGLERRQRQAADSLFGHAELDPLKKRPQWAAVDDRKKCARAYSHRSL